MTDTFWGLTATAWSAFAAAGALLAAVVAAITTGWTLRVGDARPKVDIRLGSLTEHSLTRWTLRAWPRRSRSLRDKGLQVLEVTVTNRGRTPMTVVPPRIIQGFPVWDTRHWWWRIRRFEQSVTLEALPWTGYEHRDSVRVEPFAQIKYLFDLSVFFREPRSTLLNKRPWKVLRVMVDVPGRKPIRARGSIEAHPGLPQLGGEPVTLELFLYRWFLLQALRQELHDKDSVWLGRESAGLFTQLVLDAIEEEDSPLTGGIVQRALRAFEDPHHGTLSLSLELAREAVEAGFTTYEALGSDRPRSRPVAASPDPAPPRPTCRQCLGATIMALGRRVTGPTTKPNSGNN